MKKNGQTLIEVLVGLASAVVILSAITLATVTALNNTEFSQNQNLATSYVQQGMEIVRNMRDTNFSTFNALSDHYCLASSCTALTAGVGPCGSSLTQAACGQNVSNFVREAEIDKAPSTCHAVNTNVTYNLPSVVLKCAIRT